MVCLLQLSEQLHFNWWVQAQVRAVLICDITTATHENEFLSLSKQLRGTGFGDILQLGSNNSERSDTLKWYHVFVFAADIVFTWFILHVALVMLVKCKQWWLFSRPSLHLTDDCLESAPLSFPAPRNECAEHKQVKQSAILFFSKTKSGAGESKLQVMFVFVSKTIHSVVWVPFASNNTNAKSKKNENYFLIPAWFAICYHTSEFYISSLWGIRSLSL